MFKTKLIHSIKYLQHFQIYQSCQIIKTGCLLCMRDVTAVESELVIITKQKAAMTKFGCDGYNNKFNVNNNKI